MRYLATGEIFKDDNVELPIIAVAALSLFTAIPFIITGAFILVTLPALAVMEGVNTLGLELQNKEVEKI